MDGPFFIFKTESVDKAVGWQTSRAFQFDVINHIRLRREGSTSHLYVYLDCRGYDIKVSGKHLKPANPQPKPIDEIERVIETEAGADGRSHGPVAVVIPVGNKGYAYLIARAA